MRKLIHILLLMGLAIQVPSLDWKCARSMAGFSAQGRALCRQACQKERLALLERGAGAADLRQEPTCGDFSLAQLPEALQSPQQTQAAPATSCLLALASPALLLPAAPFPMAAAPQAFPCLPATPGLRLPYAQAPPA